MPIIIRLIVPLVIAALAMLYVSRVPDAATVEILPKPIVTHHRTAPLEGVAIVYREAGCASLLHAFPASWQPFRNLIPPLADCHQVIAADPPNR